MPAGVIVEKVVFNYFTNKARLHSSKQFNTNNIYSVRRGIVEAAANVAFA